MWNKTLPQVLELQEAIEMRDAILEAHHRDAELEAKNSKP